MKAKVVLFAWLMSLGYVNCWSAAFPGSYAAITLNNADVNHPIFYGTTGNPAAGADFYVEVLGGPDANNLEPVTDLTGMHNSIFIIGAGANAPGFFDGGVGIVPGVAERTVATFQVIAWTGAPTFAAASQRVASALFTQLTGSFDPVQLPVPTVLEFPANFVIPAIPEPAVVVLSLISLLSLIGSRWLR